MYREHFGLTRRPFDSGIARDGDLYLGAAQQDMLANLGVALSTCDAVAVLTGPAGVGKTTLASAALRAQGARIALGWLGTVPTEPSDLPELLLGEFGLGSGRGGQVERLQAWRQFLSEMGATESRVLVIVEHAEELSGPVLRMLESLTAADPNGCPGANLVLTGEPELDARLGLPTLQSLRQRVRLRQLLAPLTRKETEDYIGHRLENVGGRRTLLPATALDALHTYSQGVPRVLNNLCDSALALAAARGALAPDAALIVHVAEKLFALSADAPQTTTPADSAARTADSELPVLTDALEWLDAAPDSEASEDLALLRDVRLETQRRGEADTEQQLSYAAAATAFADSGAAVDEFAATALLRARRA